MQMREGERILINGEVMREERKVQIEIMKDEKLIMEKNVIKKEEKKKKMRKIYLEEKMMIIENEMREKEGDNLEKMMKGMLEKLKDEEIMKEMKIVDEMVNKGRVLEEIKKIREKYKREDEIMGEKKVVWNVKK